MSKYIQFALILFVCVAVDQWTKHIASTHLATTHGDFSHPIVLEIDDEDAGKTVEDVLREEFRRNTDEEIREIANRYVRQKDGGRLRADSAVEGGDTLEVVYRKVVIIPKYFEFEYTRNPGAAFGLLSTADSPWRIPFFVAVSIIAIVVIIMMLRGVERRQQLTIWALSLIAGGAVGNFIDRLAYGWVVDFVVWKYTDEWRWPTFNAADAFITIGVSLLVLEMIIDSLRKRGESVAEPSTDEA